MPFDEKEWDDLRTAVLIEGVLARRGIRSFEVQVVNGKPTFTGVNAASAEKAYQTFLQENGVTR